MKVGIFDPYLDTLGGGERYMLTIASCLSEEHQVYLFWDDPAILHKSQDRFSLDLSKVEIFNNIFSPKYSFLKRILETRKFDCIFFLSDGSIPFILSKNLYVHFQFPVEWVENKSVFNRIKMAIKMTRIKQILCNSNFTKQYIDKKFGVKSKVIYPPSDIRDGMPNVYLKDKQNIILTVGRFGKLAEGRNFKKQDVLIEAFKKMVDKGLSNWRFIVVISFKEQDRIEVDKLKNMAKKYPIEILDNVPSNTLDSKYKEAEVYWHAVGFGEDLKKHPELAEHFGMATVEAMARGAVPVVFNAGGQKEIIEDDRNGFLWNTTEELIRKTNVLMQDKKRWEKMSTEAVRRARTFGGKERFYRELKAIIIQGDSFAKESPLQKG